MKTILDWLSRVVPSGTNLYGPYVKNPGKEGYIKHHEITDPKLAANHMKAMAQGGQDVYVATANFKIRKTLNTKKNLAFNRTHENVLAKRALYVDIDTNKPGAYPDKKTAIIELSKFLKNANLPKPTIVVDSGGGYHAYWTFDRDVRVEDWQPLATDFKAFCLGSGLKIDPAITADSSRILRPPETLNWKRAGNDPAKAEPVHVVKWDDNDLDFDAFKKLFYADPVRAAMRSEPAVRHVRPQGEAAQVMAGLSASTVPRYMAEIEKECLVVKHAMATGGKDFNYPVWQPLLLLAAFTEDGKDYIHEMSKNYPTYSPDKTEGKFARQQEDIANKPDLGAPHCKTLHENVPEICNKCPHFKKITSPIALGFETPSTTPGVIPGNAADPGMRYFFKRINGNNDDGLCKMVLVDPKKSKDRIATRISPAILDGFELVTDREGKQFLDCTATVKKTKMFLHVPEVAFTAQGPGIAAALTTAKVPFDDYQHAHVREYLMAWKTNLFTKQGYTKKSPQSFGWMHKGFAYGGTLFKKDDVEEPLPIREQGLAEQYSVQGTPKAWRNATKRLFNGKFYPELQILLATSFAGPLVKLTGQTGIVFGFVSQASGIGKTTTIHLAQSVWGHPIGGLHALDDTSNSVAKKMGMLSNLPVYWDELQMADNVKDFLKLAYRLSQGKEKTRLKGGGEAMMESVDWATMLIAASNDYFTSYIDTIAKGTPAGRMRVFEIIIERKPLKPDVTVAPLVSNVGENYGHIGQSYAKYLGANRKKITRMLTKEMKRLQKETKAATEERFWIAGMAAINVGAALANELEFTRFELDRIKICMLKAVKVMRVGSKAVSTFDPLEILASYLNVEISRRLVTSTTGGVGNPGTVIEKEAPSSHDKQIRYQIGADDKILLVIKKDFKKYMTDVGVDTGAFERDMEKKFSDGFEKSVQVTIAAGLSGRNIPRQQCYRIRLVKMPADFGLIY